MRNGVPHKNAFRCGETAQDVVVFARWFFFLIGGVFFCGSCFVVVVGREGRGGEGNGNGW